MNRRSFLAAMAAVAAAPQLLEQLKPQDRVSAARAARDMIDAQPYPGDTQLHSFYGPSFRPGDKIGIHGDVYTVVHAERSEDGHTGCITLDRPIAWRGRTRLLTPREVMRVFG